MMPTYIIFLLIVYITIYQQDQQLLPYTSPDNIFVILCNTGYSMYVKLPSLSGRDIRSIFLYERSTNIL